MSLILDGTTGVQGNSGAFIADTAKTASGSTVNFTGIPSWVKRIVVLLDGVSFAAAGAGVIRIGAGALETTGYTNTNTTFTNTPGININGITNGFGVLTTGGASSSLLATYVLNLIGANTWVLAGQSQRINDTTTTISNGSITLSGALDRLSVVATTSTFDAGTINILYE